MDGELLTQKNSLIVPAGLSERKRADGNLATECRNLISILSRKIEALCQVHHEDSDRVMHIRSLSASLTTLNSLLRSLEHEPQYQPERGFLEDSRGYTYVSVRNCDLERFSVK